jgi:hypothetical protein
MAFKRCEKHPDIVLYRCREWDTLRCRVCDEIRPLRAEIIALQRTAQFKHLPDPGEGYCQSCTVYRAEGEIEFISGFTLRLCRSCTGVARSKLKSLFKRMEQRAKELNKGRVNP